MKHLIVVLAVTISTGSVFAAGDMSGKECSKNQNTVPLHAQTAETPVLTQVSSNSGTVKAIIEGKHK